MELCILHMTTIITRCHTPTIRGWREKEDFRFLSSSQTSSSMHYIMQQLIKNNMPIQKYLLQTDTYIRESLFYILLFRNVSDILVPVTFPKHLIHFLCIYIWSLICLCQLLPDKKVGFLCRLFCTEQYDFLSTITNYYDKLVLTHYCKLI